MLSSEVVCFLLTLFFSQSHSIAFYYISTIHVYFMHGEIWYQICVCYSALHAHYDYGGLNQGIVNSEFKEIIDSGIQHIYHACRKWCVIGSSMQSGFSLQFEQCTFGQFPPLWKIAADSVTWGRHFFCFDNVQIYFFWIYIC